MGNHMAEVKCYIINNFINLKDTGLIQGQYKENTSYIIKILHNKQKIINHPN